MGLFDDLITEETPAGLFDDLTQPESDPSAGLASTARFGGHRDLVLESLRNYGATPTATAAIMGDIEQESSYKPRLPGDRGTSWGLLQVGTPMFRQFETDQAEKGIEPGSGEYVSNQVPFILDRFKRQHPDRWEAMQNAPSAPEALAIFRGTKDWGYGIAGGRYKYAQDYAEALRGVPVEEVLSETRIEKAKPVLVQEMEVRKAQAVNGNGNRAGAFETILTKPEEQQFQQWKANFAPKDSGDDYDLRGAFKAGLSPDASGHWPDTFKKPNHPTFSDQSIYARDVPEKAGRWEGEKFVPPPGMFDDLITEGKSAEVPRAANIGKVAGMFDDLISLPSPDLPPETMKRLPPAYRESIPGVGLPPWSEYATAALRRGDFGEAVKIAGTATSQGVRRGLNLPVEGPVSTQDIGEIMAPSGPPLVGREYLTREEREPVSAAGTVKKAGYNLLVDSVNFFNSPEGAAVTAATGGAAAIKPVIGRFVAMGFGADAARNAIDAAREGRWADALESLGLTALLGHGAKQAAKVEFPVERPVPRVVAPGEAAGLEPIAPELPGQIGAAETARVDPVSVSERQASRTAGPTGETPVPQPAPETSVPATDVPPPPPPQTLKTFADIPEEFVKPKERAAIDPALSERVSPEELAELHDFALSGKSNQLRRLDLGKVIDEHVQEIQSQINEDISGYRHTIDNYGIRHALKEHGNPVKEEPRGQIAITKDDFKLIPEILAAPDRIESAGITSRGQPTIRYIKRANGTIYYVEETRSGKGELAFETMYKRKPEASDAPAELPPPSPTKTSETFPGEIKSSTTAGKPQDISEFGPPSTRPEAGGSVGAPDVFGFGPGAAAAGEKLTAYEQRAFAERLQADQSLAGQLRENIGNRYYEPIPNTVTAETAADVVNQRGIVQSINAITDPQSPMPFHIRSTIGQIVLKRLNEGFRRLERTDPVAADELLNRSVEVAEWLEEFGTRLGQGVQSFALWSRLTPEGQLIKVQRAVRRTRERYEGEHPGEVKEIVDGASKPGFSFGGLARTNATAKLVKPLWTKLIDAARQGLLNDQSFYDITAERLGLPRFNKQIAAEIVRLANEIDAAPEGIPKNDAQLKLAKFITRQLGFAPKDLPIGIYYGNMLSGYNTQLVNTVDTLLNVVSEVNGLAIANPRAAATIYNGLVRGFLDGRADFALAITRGRMITDGKWMEVPRLMEAAEFGRKGGVPIRTDTRTGRFMKAIAESRPGGILNAWKYVTRLMAASDSLMFRGAYEARIALLSDRLAREEGLSGRALDKRIEQLLGTEAGRMAQHEAQARQEGFTGVAARARRSELRELQRNADHRADAAEFAGVATYNHEPTGFLGYIAKGVGQFSEQYPLMKIFVPFTRIVANVTNRGLNYTPLGFKRAWNEPPGSDARASMIARATFGTAGLTLLGTMQAAGVLQIHGAGPTDPERRRQLQAAGWKAYSLQIGDTFVSYIYTPIGLGLSILGNMTDSARYGELKQGDAVTRGAYAVSRIGSTIFSQSFLSGLSNLFGALSNEPGQVITSLKQTLASTAGTFTTPAIFRDIQRLFDPKRYQANSIAGEMLRNTPFASAVNRPALNAFGEPVEYPASRFFSHYKDDPAWRIVVKMGLRVPVPDRYSEVPDGLGGTRRITPDEYYEYLRSTGPQVKQFIESVGDRWDTLDPATAQTVLSEWTKPIREEELASIYMKADQQPQ